MSPFVSENIYHILTPFLEALFNFTMASSLLSTFLDLCSYDVCCMILTMIDCI
jgi:hypothetical protein